MAGIMVVGARHAGRTVLAEIMREKMMLGGTPDVVIINDVGEMSVQDLKTQYSEAIAREQLRTRIRSVLKPNLFDTMGMTDSAFDKWRKGLTESTILSEYFLIKEKKSTLSRAKRDYITRICN